MGNKLGRRRQVVDDKYTRPQGLYQIKDVDYKKLRKLILDSKLAPCHPGGDECDCGLLEECPICFLYYPTLNRSRCCTKSICTECFLQMKNPSSTHPTQCPFCKTANYAVEYRGGKTKEERGLEQIEEQKVIEAKLRMRQQELQQEEEKMSTRQEVSSSSGVQQVNTFGCTESAANYAVEYRGGKTKEERELEQKEEQKVIDAKLRMRQQELHQQEEKMSTRQEVSSSSGVQQVDTFGCTESAANYAVEYRGGKTKEERELEQKEEQKVIEAKLRMRQQEEEKMSTRQEVSSSSGVQQVDTFGCTESAGGESEEVVSLQDPNASQMFRQAQHRRLNRDDDFELDLEDIMVMEAIWLSIQEHGRPRHEPYDDVTPEHYPSNCYVSHSQLTTPVAGLGSTSSSPSGGLACAIAALAERQQMSGESSGSDNGNHMTSFDMVATSSRRNCSRARQIRAKYPPAQPWNSREELCINERAAAPGDEGDWSVDHGSLMAEAGTSYAGSDDLDEGNELTELPPPPSFGMDGSCYGNSEETAGGRGGHGGLTVLPQQLPAPPAVAPYGAEGSFQSVPGPIIPESFEEQMMLAMAVSLAEARARTSAQGFAWL